MTPISRKEIQQLEESTTRIENISRGTTLFISPAKRLILVHRMLRLQGWYHTWDLPAGSQMRRHWAKMSELLGTKPTLYRNYSYRTALWAFEWQGLKVLLYASQRGLSLQVSQNFPPDKVNPLITMLSKKLRRSRSNG